MQLTNQKRLAAKILGCGENRVWINPDYIDEIASSVQADDIREFIEEGLIRAKAVKGTSRVRARTRQEQRAKGRQKGQGKRMGLQMLVTSKEPMDANHSIPTTCLKDLREADEITPSQYRRYYLKAKGGSYRSIATCVLK